MVFALLGLSAMVIVAPSPCELIERTSPTMTPRSLTSECGSNWLPVWSVSSFTRTTVVNFWS